MAAANDNISMTTSINTPSGVKNVPFVQSREIVYETSPPAIIELDSSIEDELKRVQERIAELQSIQKSFLQQVQAMMSALPPGVLRQNLPETPAAVEFIAAMKGLLGDQADEIITDGTSAAGTKHSARRLRPRV